jgi:hypothetical protein
MPILRRSFWAVASVETMPGGRNDRSGSDERIAIRVDKNLAKHVR